MLRIFSLAYLCLSLLGSVFLTHAAEPSTELSVKSVNVMDSKKVRIAFSDGIDMTSIVLKISKQSDNSSVVISELIWVKDILDSVDVILESDLEEGSSYTLTVQAAIWTSGSTIIDGAGALKEFVTPSPLKKAEVVLSAPVNPAAVIVKEDEKEITSAKTPTVVTPLEEESPVPTEELPLTGMNPFFFLLLALPFAYILLRKKSAT